MYINQYRLQGTCKICKENIKRMNVYKIRILFFTLLLAWVWKRLSQTVPNPKHVHFRKGESLTFMTFHDMHARTHARTHVRNVQNLLYAPYTLRCRCR